MLSTRLSTSDHRSARELRISTSSLILTLAADFSGRIHPSSIHSFYALLVCFFSKVWGSTVGRVTSHFSLCLCSPCLELNCLVLRLWAEPLLWGESRRESVLWVMESTMKDLRDGATVLDPKSYACGGVEDVYGEDRATEDQLVTPWTFSVARSIFLNFA